MRYRVPSASLVSLAFAVFLSLLAEPTEAQSPKPSVLQIGEQYLATYGRGDADGLAAFLTPESVLEDPTGAAMGREIRFIGVNRILPWLKQSFAAVTTLHLEITERFSTGPYAIYSGVLHYSVPGVMLGVQTEEVSMSPRFTVVLEIRNGKVMHHTDYVDYESVMAQVQQLRKSP